MTRAFRWRVICACPVRLCGRTDPSKSHVTHVSLGSQAAVQPSLQDSPLWGRSAPGSELPYVFSVEGTCCVAGPRFSGGRGVRPSFLPLPLLPSLSATAKGEGAGDKANPHTPAEAGACYTSQRPPIPPTGAGGKPQRPRPESHGDQGALLRMPAFPGNLHADLPEWIAGHHPGWALGALRRERKKEMESSDHKGDGCLPIIYSSNVKAALAD